MITRIWKKNTKLWPLPFTHWDEHPLQDLG